MKNKKMNGSISLILIFVISIVSIIIFYISSINNQNIAIFSYSRDNYQASLIADSYIKSKYLEIRDVIKHNRNLFPELEHNCEIEVSNIEENKIPYLNICASVNYEGIELSKTGRVTKYNPIFFKGMPVLKKELLEKEDRELLEIVLKKYIDNEHIYKNAPETITLEKNHKIASNIIPFLYAYENDKTIVMKNLNSSKIYEVNSPLVIGDMENFKGNVELVGIMFLNSNIILNTNFIFNGIIISNSGSISTNGFKGKINGILIELQEGNFSQTDITYNKDFIVNYVKYFPWAEHINLEYIIQNN